MLYRAAVKSKSAEVKEKLMEYIVNGSAGAEPAERHVSASDRITKRYRNMAPIFSIDDNDADTPGEFLKTKFFVGYVSVLIT